MSNSQRVASWRRPRGFALIYAVVVLAILAVVAVMALPILAGTQQTANVKSTLSELRAIEKGTCCGATSFNQVVSENIGIVSELALVIRDKKDANPQINSCGGTFGNNRTKAWNNSSDAPFIPFFFDSLGFAMPIGTMVNAITQRSGVKNDNNIYLNITNVDTSDANLMDIIGDTTTGALGGQIQWPTVGNPVTVKYRIDLQNGGC